MDTVASHVPRRIAAPATRRGGFALIGILVVIAVFGVLTTLVIPAFLGMTEWESGATAETLPRAVSTAVETAADEPGGDATLTTGTMRAIEPVLSWPSAADAAATRAEVPLSGAGGGGGTPSTSPRSGVVHVSPRAVRPR